MDSQTTKTTCPYCGVGCGVLATRHSDGQVTIKGDKQHPANFGRLCSKGSALGETLDYQGRLLQPQINQQPSDWDNALQQVGDKLTAIINQHGPDAVAFYVSGQLLTEDYYVANKLMKGYIGSANIDTNSRLCMSSAVAAHKRAFGSDTVPCSYQDLEQANLIIITGSNLAWCHPVLYQRILVARKQNPQLRIVVIDPRRSATCDAADLHLAIKPGSDAIFFNGLLNWLSQHDYNDTAFVEQHCEGVTAALQSASDCSIEAVARQCELSPAEVETCYQWFAQTEKSITLFSQGINQSSSGTDKGNAIINCHLLTGRIGKSGSGPFSITGQPNAMGGREVGGLANQLAAHMDISDAGHRELVQRFWQSPVIADHDGYKAVDLFKRIDTGEVKAIWIMATNPVDSMPQANQIREVLKKCPLVIVSDCMSQTDTVELADIALPALAWGEKDGTVTNSERCISRQKAFLNAPGEALPDWKIICEVAKRMGFAEAFDFDSPAAIFDEYAQLTAFNNDGQRDLNLSGLIGLDSHAYDELAPSYWPCLDQQSSNQYQHLFSNGRFYTKNQRARFIAITPRLPAMACNQALPLLLNSGRSRDQWHTMTRSGKSARLSAHATEPLVSIHPQTAAKLGLEDQQLVKVSNKNGCLLVRCQFDDSQRPNEVFLPMHWSEQFASAARVDVLVNDYIDPVSGQPEFKQVPVTIEPMKRQWLGFLLSKRQLKINQAAYWSCVKTQSGWLYHLADEQMPSNWQTLVRQWLCSDQPSEWIEFTDAGLGYYRAARLTQGKLDSCIYLNFAEALTDKEQSDPQWLIDLFNDQVLSNADRRALLSGSPARAGDDRGATVCACFSVGIKQITKAIKEQSLMSVEDITRTLQAGGNCGSCVPELRKILAQTQQ